MTNRAAGEYNARGRYAQDKTLMVPVTSAYTSDRQRPVRYEVNAFDLLDAVRELSDFLRERDHYLSEPRTHSIDVAFDIDRQEMWLAARGPYWKDYEEERRRDQRDHEERMRALQQGQNDDQ